MSAPKPEISSQGSSDPNDEALDNLFAKRSCCGSFWSFQSLDSDRSSSSSADAASAAGSPWWKRFAVCGTDCSPDDDNDDYEPWYKKGWNKVREWSELLAGPRWKTFIRRLGKNIRSNGKGGPGQFRYDPLSYSLNFDEGIDGDLDVDTLRRDFSSRYASIPASCKSSMDLGRFNSGPLYT